MPRICSYLYENKCRKIKSDVRISPLRRAAAAFINTRRLSGGAVSYVYDCCFKDFDEDIKPDASNYSYKLVRR